VLVVDLDPRTNAAVMLIGEERWHELDGKSNTLATLFADALNDSEDFKPGRVPQKTAGDVVEARTVDLLPSSLRLVGLQDKITLTPGGVCGTRTPVTILPMGVQNLIADYDYVLVDRPPNLGHVTLDGPRISDGYVIPAIPDILPACGMPRIVAGIHAFPRDIFKETGRSVQPMGSFRQSIAPGLKSIGPSCPKCAPTPAPRCSTIRIPLFFRPVFPKAPKWPRWPRFIKISRLLTKNGAPRSRSSRRKIFPSNF
jgi:hypothetical protein